MSLLPKLQWKVRWRKPKSTNFRLKKLSFIFKNYPRNPKGWGIDDFKIPYLKVRKDNAKFSIELKEYELCQLGDLASEVYNIKF